MRPPEFTGGNLAKEQLTTAQRYSASMRPPEFTGGNCPDWSIWTVPLRLQ